MYIGARNRRKANVKIRKNRILWIFNKTFKIIAKIHNPIIHFQESAINCKTDFCKNPTPKFDGLPSLSLRSNNFYLYLWFTMSNLGILFLKWLRLGYTMKKGKIVQPLLFFLHLLNCLKFLWWKLFLSIKMSFSPRFI